MLMGNVSRVVLCCLRSSWLFGFGDGNGRGGALRWGVLVCICCVYTTIQSYFWYGRRPIWVACAARARVLGAEMGWMITGGFPPSNDVIGRLKGCGVQQLFWSTLITPSSTAAIRDSLPQTCGILLAASPC